MQIERTVEVFYVMIMINRIYYCQLTESKIKLIERVFSNLIETSKTIHICGNILIREVLFSIKSVDIISIFILVIRI